MTDQEFCKKINNKILTRLYQFSCQKEVTKLFEENGWDRLTAERSKRIEDLYEELKPAFIDFAQSGPDTNNIEYLPILFSKHLIFLNRRRKVEKIRKKFPESCIL